MLCALVMLPAAGGCSSTPAVPPKPPTIKVLRVVNHFGGTHYRTIIHDGVWYQTFDSSLLVLNPEQLTVVKQVDFGKAGEVGPATDMIIDEANKRMFIIIEDDEVIELSLTAPQAPEIVRRLDAAKLGIHPHHLSSVEGVYYVSGTGGVVRLSDLTRVLSSPEDAGRVARSAHGLVVTIGRQVHRLEDDKYIGSASDLQMLPTDAVAGQAGEMLFTLQGEQGALVGLMSPEVREIDSAQAKVAAKGIVRSVKVIGKMVWIVTDESVRGYSIGPDALEPAITCDVLGARDVDRISENYLAIAGSFGRSIYRIVQDAKGEGSTFVRGQREPSGLLAAVTDGQHILAGGPQGLWMYLINSRVELTNRKFDKPPPNPPRRAALVTAQAQISDDNTTLTVTPSPAAAASGTANAPSGAGGAASGRGAQQPVSPTAWTYTEPGGSLIHCVVAIDGENFWIGHDKGITVLKPILPAAPPVKFSMSGQAPSTVNLTDHVVGRLRMDGPVLHIYPLMVGGGASYVSVFGGFGVAQFVEEPSPVVVAK